MKDHEFILKFPLVETISDHSNEFISNEYIIDCWYEYFNHNFYLDKTEKISVNFQNKNRQIIDGSQQKG